jgi:hypothetical protein
MTGTATGTTPSALNQSRREPYAAREPGLPPGDQWKAAFGATVHDLVNVGFVAFAAAMVHDGVVPVEHMGDSRFNAAYDDLTPTEALAVLDDFYSADLESAAAWARAQERPGYEKWSPSPLLDSPVILIGDGTRVAPWPRAIVDRFSPAGLFYPAAKAFGDRFPEALGRAFEAYVGEQLGLLEHATVTGERTYRVGKEERKTCDWFVVADQCVLVVEVKASRPNLAVRLGLPEGMADIDRKLGHAARQLNRTARLIRDRHSVVADIPADRPIVGTVITLEPFFLTDGWLYEDVLGGWSVPICVTSAHTLESITATLAPQPDTGARIASAFTTGTDSDGIPLIARLDRAIEELDRVRNPILEKAWERIGPRIA